jgi:chromosome segregation ATPase
MNIDKYQKQLAQRIEKLEASRNDWKAKNKERYEDIKALKMRLKETQESRDRWKIDCNRSETALKEAQQAQARRDTAIANLTKELEDLKKKKVRN